MHDRATRAPAPRDPGFRPLVPVDNGRPETTRRTGVDVIRGVVMDEARLLEKLRAIEALFAGATTEGECVAAGEARKRIQLRLKTLEEADPPVEYKFRVADGWSAKLFMALCRRYDIKPYRYRGQR